MYGDNKDQRLPAGTPSTNKLGHQGSIPTETKIFGQEPTDLENSLNFRAVARASQRDVPDNEQGKQTEEKGSNPYMPRFYRGNKSLVEHSVQTRGKHT